MVFGFHPIGIDTSLEGALSGSDLSDPIYNPQMTMTIDGETSPIFSASYTVAFTDWLNRKLNTTTTDEAKQQAQNEYNTWQSEVNGVNSPATNISTLVYVDNFSGKDVTIYIDCNNPSPYHCVSNLSGTDGGPSITKLSDGHWVVRLASYVEPTSNTVPVDSTGDGWTKIQYDPMVDEPQVMGSTPFITDTGNGVGAMSLAQDGIHVFNLSMEDQQALMQSKVIKIKPASGTSFGTMIMTNTIVLDWGGNKFDAGLTDPAVAANMLSMVGITDTNVALAFNGDYSQAGEPTMVTGLLKVFSPQQAPSYENGCITIEGLHEIASLTPIMIDTGSGYVDVPIYSATNFYYYDVGSSTAKIKPKDGDTFGSIRLNIDKVLSWGGCKFDAYQPYPPNANINAFVTDWSASRLPDTALAVKSSADYSQAGEPTIVNGVFVRF